MKKNVRDIEALSYSDMLIDLFFVHNRATVPLIKRQNKQSVGGFSLIVFFFGVIPHIVGLYNLINILKSFNTISAMNLC